MLSIVHPCCTSASKTCYVNEMQARNLIDHLLIAYCLSRQCMQHTRSHRCTHECSCRTFLLNFGFCLHFRKLLLILFSFRFFFKFSVVRLSVLKGRNSACTLHIGSHSLSFGSALFFCMLVFFYVFHYCFFFMYKKQAALAATIPSTITTTTDTFRVALHCRHIQIETMLLYVIFLRIEAGREKEWVK